MLTNQVLNSIIEKAKQTVKADCSVWDIQRQCLATTCEEDEAIKRDVDKFIQMAEYRDTRITEKCACFSIRDEEQLIYVFVIHSAMENVDIIGKLVAERIEVANRYHEKRMSKNRFFQQLLLDNMLLVDVYNQAKKLYVDIEAKRVVFVIEPTKQKDNIVIDTLKGLYMENSQDFVTAVEEGRIVLIKHLDKADEYEDVHEMGLAMVDTLISEAMIDVRVAYGTIVTELKDVSKCYKEACMALDVGKIFYKDRTMLAYNELGIGRLIHQLPISLCEMFLQEVFKGAAMELFDEEILTTVNAFFENNLNISETARQMYLHRNTLGYRLEKIMKTTGLDVRKFEDALTFKIAMMVSDHMKFLKNQQ